MIGFAIVIAVLAAVAFALLRYHPTMRYPAYVVEYGGTRYMMRPRGINVWTRKQRKRYLEQMALYSQAYEYQRRFRTELLIAERVGMSVHRPENFIKIAGI